MVIQACHRYARIYEHSKHAELENSFNVLRRSSLANRFQSLRFIFNDYDSSGIIVWWNLLQTEVEIIWEWLCFISSFQCSYLSAYASLFGFQTKMFRRFCGLVWNLIAHSPNLGVILWKMGKLRQRDESHSCADLRRDPLQKMQASCGSDAHVFLTGSFPLETDALHCLPCFGFA